MSDQRRISNANDDFGREIEINEQFVSEGDMGDLGKDPVEYYHNRAFFFRKQGRFAEAIADYSKTIEIQEQIVRKENRPMNRCDLAQSLYDRGVSRTLIEQWKEAGEDIDRSGIILRELIEQGQKYVLVMFLWMGGFRCGHAEKMGNAEKAAQWANDAMQWFCEEVRAGRSKKLLPKTAERFAVHVESNLEVLLKNGLNEELWVTFRKTLEEARRKISG